ncbi:CHAT domain-containing protein [Spirosoma panaciterrae]|uniref:CHAT domain-containing protein n=1 Tax=Spirosoma panaciterrae TaxID=496058 RepID=UPI00036ECAEB|nr:CHAT domain-containing tetratricopeptide repeat protein [Spirosoma panaciterrae]
MFKKRLCRVAFVILFQLGVGSVQAQNWQVLCKQVDSLREAGNFSLAIQVAKQALNVAKETVGETHSNYAGSLKQLGEVLAEKGDYEESNQTTLSSRDLYKKLAGVLDTNYINTTVTLGVVARFRNKFSASEHYYQEALELTEKLKGKETIDYVSVLGDLGTMYLVSGNLDKAETILLTTLALKGKLIGRDTDEYSVTLNSLGMLFSGKDDFARAESYLLASLQIRERLLPARDHPYMAPPLSNLAYVYERQGSYFEALKLYNQSIRILEKHGITSQIYLGILNNAAVAYTQIKAYVQADSLYRKLQPLLAKNIGIDNPQYAVLLGNRGVLQSSLGKYNDARQLLEQAYALSVAKVSEKHPYSIKIMSSLAEVYGFLGMKQTADSLFRKMDMLAMNSLGMANLDYANSLDKFSRFCIDDTKVDESYALTNKAVTIVKTNLTRSFLYQTTRQQENILTKSAPFIRTAFDIAYQRPGYPHTAQLAYSSALFLKNLLLSQHINLFSNGQPEVGSKLADTLRLVSSKIAAQYALPNDQRKNLDSLENRFETLEKELARQSAEYRRAQQLLQVRWQGVRDALKATEAAVEFMSFPYYNGHYETDTIRYIAVVLRPGDESPQVVPLLADEAPLRQLLIRKGAGHEALYATRGSELDTDQLTKGDSLYQLIWQPIDKLLKGAKTVYISPSGLLHQVAFAALPYSRMNGKKTGFLADRYQLRQVGSTRQIVTAFSQEEAFYQGIDQAKLYGGIRYDSVDTQSAKTWPFLPGTLREVDQISQLIGPKAKVVTGPDASEASIKSLSGKSPSVLHIATHGFTFPDPTTIRTDSSLGGNTFRQISNPLFRSGLLMAGSNRIWQGAKSALGEEDGILTAYEVANLDLSNTKLVVLSACETALGDIRGSEGVFGLQRAFKMAGVDYLVVSLWPVADDVTTTLMTRFYQNWKRYKTIRTAFQKTQSQMRKMYPPSVWAAFVLVE